MKTSFAGLAAATGLFLAATGAHAQEETPNTDFDKIGACFDSIKSASAVSATISPKMELSVYVNGKLNDATCGMTLHGVTNEKSEQTEYDVETFAVVGNHSYRMSGDFKTSGFNIDVDYDGVKYKAAPIPGEDDMRIEITGPTSLFANDMETLEEEAKAGRITMTAKDDITTVTIAKGNAYDWMPEDIADNIMMTMLGTLEVSERLDSDEIGRAAEKSAEKSASVIMPKTAPEPVF
jgi:hypothetical protein